VFVRYYEILYKGIPRDGDVRERGLRANVCRDGDCDASRQGRAGQSVSVRSELAVSRVRAVHVSIPLQKDVT
jgi:hypothetical protein